MSKELSNLIENTEQENFDFWVENTAQRMGKTIDEVLNMAMVREYSLETGIKYKGGSPCYKSMKLTDEKRQKTLKEPETESSL